MFEWWAARKSEEVEEVDSVVRMSDGRRRMNEPVLVEIASTRPNNATP